MSRQRTRNSGSNPLDALAAAQRVAEAAGQAATPLDLPAGPALDARGYPRNGCTRPGANVGHEPANKGKTYGPNPPSIEECFAMLAACDDTVFGRRTHAAILLLWQGALRAFEALKLRTSDLDTEKGRIRIIEGKGGKSATISMAAWAWELFEPWLEVRATLSNANGPILPVIDGPTAGRAWGYADLTRALKRTAVAAGIDPERKRISAHQFRHAWTIQGYSAGVPLRTLQLHLRHENIGITDTYLQGLGAHESREQVYELAMPMVPASVLLNLPAARRDAAVAKELVA